MDALTFTESYPIYAPASENVQTKYTYSILANPTGLDSGENLCHELIVEYALVGDVPGEVEETQTAEGTARQETTDSTTDGTTDDTTDGTTEADGTEEVEAGPDATPKWSKGTPWTYTDNYELETTWCLFYEPTPEGQEDRGEMRCIHADFNRGDDNYATFNLGAGEENEPYLFIENFGKNFYPSGLTPNGYVTYTEADGYNQISGSSYFFQNVDKTYVKSDGGRVQVRWCDTKTDATEAETVKAYIVDNLDRTFYIGKLTGKATGVMQTTNSDINQENRADIFLDADNTQPDSSFVATALGASLFLVSMF